MKKLKLSEVKKEIISKLEKEQNFYENKEKKKKIFTEP